jgi:hypothetical protein
MHQVKSMPQAAAFDWGMAKKNRVLSLSSARLNAATSLRVDRLPRKIAVIFSLAA